MVQRRFSSCAVVQILRCRAGANMDVQRRYRGEGIVYRRCRRGGTECRGGGAKEEQRRSCRFRGGGAEVQSCGYRCAVAY